MRSNYGFSGQPGFTYIAFAIFSNNKCKTCIRGKNTPYSVGD